MGSLLAQLKLGRPPRGGRGLKLLTMGILLIGGASRPPRGGRGLKSASQSIQPYYFGRPPRGGRGLKCYRLYDGSGYQYVAPLAGGVD